MVERYKTIYSGGEAETLEKKSRFIANVRLAESEEEALAFIEEMKKSIGMPAITALPIQLGNVRKL